MDEASSDPAMLFRQHTRTTLSPYPSSPSPTQPEADLLALTGGDGDDRDGNDAKLELFGNSDNSPSQYQSSLLYGQAVKWAKHGMSAKFTANFDLFLKMHLPL